MILFHFLTTTLTLTIASGGKETESRSLHLFLDEHYQKWNNADQNKNDIFHLPNGILSSCGYPVISRTLALEGMRTELHICISSDDLETENGLDSSSANGDSLLAIFRIRNSTVSLTSFCLNSEEPSSLIASASSSCVTVSDSDIRSNGMNCPFVMLVGMVDGQSGDFGSSLDIRKCRHVSSSLLSLVPLAHISHKSDLAMNAGQQVLIFEETQFGEETTISASELAICNCRLTFGTGPLIGFGCDKDKTERGGEQAILPRKVSTLLAKSQIMNTTSHPSKRIVEDAGRMELTQRVTSSCVCSSTNHLYGTACVDMNANVMESLLSVNTSFLSCLTDTPTNLGQHFKTQQNTTESPAFFKLCTFKDCSAARGGGAIYLSGKGSLLVEECSFRKCRCDQYGGAIYFYPPIGFTFSAASSSFADCSSDYAVGSLNLISCLSSTLINCVFIDSTSQVCGGSVFLDKWDAASTSSSITNCLFENSRATTTYPEKPFSGGALYFSQAKSIQLNFVNFRGNEAGINPGNDIMSVSTAASLFTSETIVGCSSTSDSPRMRVYEEAEGTDDHLPNPTMIVIHVSCMATEIDVDKAEFTLKMSTAITGTVLVLIDNSDGTRTPTSDQAPNIGRVLAFSFDRSDSSSCCVSLGESNLVQEPLSDYHVVTSSFVGSFMLSASCVLDESERNSLITISGKNIPSGILSVTLSEDTVLNFEFQPKQTTSDVLKIHLSGDSPQLGFGKTYRIVSAESQTPPTQHIAMPFLIEIVIPDPPRLTTLHEPEYDSALKTVRISLEGVNLEGTHEVTLSVNGTETVTIDVLFSSSEGHLGGILFDTETPTNVNLSYNTRYEIIGMKKDDVKVLCLGVVSFETITEPTRVAMVSLIPNSIDTFISIQLSGHGFIGTYAVTLSSGFSFIISAQSDTSAVSEEIALGWPDSLAFNTLHHPINRVHKPRYDPLSLFVDGRIGERSRFCGESSRPCLSVEVGWEIVSQLGVRTPTIGIVHSATLGSRIRISNGMVALLSNFGNVEPKLRIPSSACESVESGMIVVSSSTLEIRDVDIVIDSLSPLFVLLSARNSSLALKEGSFIGPKSTPSSNDELSEELCSWTSGIVQLDDCNTSISDTKLNHLSFGAINMNGSLEVVTSSFHANSPTLSSFPSLSRNIHCSNGGDIEIGSLSGGDGTPTSPSPWISQNDCSLEGLESIYSTPLFVPTLNTNESKTKFAKKTETFEVEIVGTILIPCGLFLEVFEKTTDEKKENHVQFELNLDTAQSFTEKTIKLAISQGSLKKLDSSLEWRGRLLFGSRSTPTSDSTPEAGALRTSESFKIQSSISERRAESVKANMKWWLPLVISLCVVVLFLMIVVFGCWRRRGQAEKKKTSQPDAEPQEMDFEKVEDCDGSLNNTLHVSSARELNGNTRFELEQEKQGSGECKDGTEGMIPEKDRVEALCVKEGKFETVVVNKTHTLYERLHVEKVGIDRRRVASMIVRGLTELSRRGQNATGLRLSSHWVLFSESGEVCLRVKGEKEGLSEFVEKGKSEVRWRSPEQKNGEEVSGDVDAEQVTVFRLGLVLFEIETGQIPFGETDEVNASRALHCGTIPKMDGIGDEMEKLIVWCLSVTAGSRPSLRTIGSVLGSIGKMEGVGNAPSIVS